MTLLPPWFLADLTTPGRMPIKSPTNVWGYTYRQNKENSARKQSQPLPAFHTFQNKTTFETGNKKTRGSLGDERMDWGSLVENVFREEIGKMAERYQRDNK